MSSLSFGADILSCSHTDTVGDEDSLDETANEEFGHTSTQELEESGEENMELATPPVENASGGTRSYLMFSENTSSIDYSGDELETPYGLSLTVTIIGSAVIVLAPSIGARQIHWLFL